MSSRPGRDRDERPSARARAGRSGATSTSSAPGPRPEAVPRRPRPNVRLPYADGAMSFAPSRSLAAVLIAALTLAGVGGCAALSASLPDPSTTKARGRDQSTIILDRERPPARAAVRRAEPKRPAAPEDACLTAAGRGGDRGPALLRARGRRPDRHREGARGRRGSRQEVAGRLDHHAAVREERLRHAREDDQAQGRRGAARQQARAELHQGPDPGALPQHHLLRTRMPTVWRPPRRPTSARASRSSTSPSPRCWQASSSRPDATPPTWTRLQPSIVATPSWGRCAHSPTSRRNRRRPRSPNRSRPRA